MKYFDLKQGNIEDALAKFDFSNEETEKIAEDVSYFDRYFLIQEGNNIGFLTVLSQHFNDPYMNLELDSCDLLDYKGRVPLETFLKVMDEIFKTPQIARAKPEYLDAFLKRGFGHIKNRGGGNSTLYQIFKDLKKEELTKIDDDRIRRMTSDDLKEVQRLFEEEYAARFRVVKKMFLQDPQSCFVFEEYDTIKGVSFNEQREDCLYSKQLFVKKSERGKGIDRKLLMYTALYALKQGYDKILGNVRDRTLRYYRKKWDSKPTGDVEYYLIRCSLKPNLI